MGASPHRLLRSLHPNDRYARIMSVEIGIGYLAAGFPHFERIRIEYPVFFPRNDRFETLPVSVNPILNNSFQNRGPFVVAVTVNDLERPKIPCRPDMFNCAVQRLFRNLRRQGRMGNVYGMNIHDILFPLSEMPFGRGGGYFAFSNTLRSALTVSLTFLTDRGVMKMVLSPAIVPRTDFRRR
jgi:hypothetical protein